MRGTTLHNTKYRQFSDNPVKVRWEREGRGEGAREAGGKGLGEEEQDQYVMSEWMYYLRDDVSEGERERDREGTVERWKEGGEYK